jgi:hypothetical protein
MMKPHPPTKLATRIAHATVLAAAAILLLLAMPGAATPSNNGTVKVHNFADLGDVSNDPQPGCAFYVEGFGMEATSGTLTIDQQPPTGTANVVSTTWASNDAANDGFADHHFLNGPFNLPAGHYKLFVSDTQHDKQKVFTVECTPPCEEDCPTSTTTTTSETNSTTPSTEIPFFPPGPGLALGSLGAAVAGFLMVRRKL